MPKRDNDWNHQVQPRRISRKLRKTMQNVFRRYLGNTRQEVRDYVNLMCKQNQEIPVKNRKRVHRLTTSVMPCGDYMDSHAVCPKYLVVHIHGSCSVSEEA